jgi:hypothetical protein
MRATSKVMVVVAVLLGVTSLSVGPDRGWAQHETLATRSVRDGTLARTAHYQFEVFCYATGVRIFVTDRAGAAVSASGLNGAATFYHPNSPDPWFTQPLHPAAAQPGQPAESLDLAMDLSTVPISGATVTFEVAGLPDPREPTAKFRTPFTPLNSGSSSSHAVAVLIPNPTYPASADIVHYFPVAGFYQTTSGVLIWVPAPGYYYGTAFQYYPHLQAWTWQSARAAADPRGNVTTPRSTGAPDWIQWELYWRPRAMGDTESYWLWLRREMRLQRLAGRSPSMVNGNCARCHRR